VEDCVKVLSPIEEALARAVSPRMVSGGQDIPWWMESRPQMGAVDLRSTTIFTRQHQADPIFTPIFTYILGTGGFLIGGTTFISFASIASAIATTALTMGIQMLLMKPPKPDKVRQPMMQAIPPRWWGVGQTRISGAMMLWEAKLPWLCSVQAVCGHPIESFETFYLHDDQVTLTGDPADPAGATVDVQPKGRYGGNRIRMFTRLGAVPETAFEEIVDLLEADDVWTEDHRLDGQASIGIIARRAKTPENQRKTYPYGPPMPSAVCKLAKCWDFRDPDQDPDDETTWEWTRNSVVILAWHECFSPFGSKRDFRTAILPVLDMWQEEADVCDELINTAIGGTEKRYECDGTGTADLDPKVGTNAILASMDGWMCERGDGALLVVAGKFREKYVGTLTDADIVGHSIQHDVLPEEEINRVIPKFNYPATDYTETDTDFWEDTAAQVIAGRVLSQPAEYDFVTKWRQARRLGKRDYMRARAKRRGRIDTRLTGINAVYLPWMRLSTPKRLPALDGVLFSNRRSVLNLMKGGFSMDVIQMPEDIDAWTPASDEGAAPPIPPKPDPEEEGVPTIDSIAALISGDSVYLQVALVDPANDTLIPWLAWRVQDTGSGDPGAWVELRFPDAEPDAGLIILNTGAVPADTILEVRAAYSSGSGDKGEWTDPPEEISTTIDTVAPAALTSFAITGGVALALGHAPLTFTTTNDAHLHAIAIYRVPTGVTLDKDAHFAFRVNALLGTTFSYVDGDNTPTNLLPQGAMASDTWTKGTNWTHGSGKYTHAAGVASNLFHPVISAMSAIPYRIGFEVSGRTAGSVTPFTSSAIVLGTAVSANGQALQKLTPAAGATSFAFNAASAFDGAVDNAYFFAETGTCAPQGDWDYYAIPENRSRVEGPQATKLDIVIV
jgi:hypothetical protein